MGVSVQTPAFMCERHARKPSGVAIRSHATRRSDRAADHPGERLAAGSPISLPLSPWPDDGANAIASGARGRERRYSPIVVPEGVVVSM
jgi:hypothetical protein